MRRLSPGVYDDGEGGLHLDVPELLADNDIADTPENRDTVERLARQCFAQLGFDVEVDE